MSLRVTVTDNAAEILSDADSFLRSDPVRHNVVLTLLHERAAAPADGRYVLVSDGDRAVGALFQSPLTFMATLTPMPHDAVEACADRLAGDPPPLPGVGGEAATAAHFAGAWTERTKRAATPQQGQRIYEAVSVTEPTGVLGEFRCATEADRPLLTSWLQAFHDDTGEGGGDPATKVDRRVAEGQFWIWADDEPRSMAALTAPTAGVARVQAVYTPPEHRGSGYASACVAALTARTLQANTRCILYTDLGNPTSNSIYRRMGYRAVTEVLRYTLD